MNSKTRKFLHAFRSIKRPFADFVNYSRNHKILVQAENRIDGILYTLVGWGLISLATIAFQNTEESMPSRVNFLIQFLSGGLFLFFLGIFKGFSFFKVRELAETQKMRGEVPYLSAKERVGLIVVRSVIAVLGYEFYSLARVFTTTVDNSAVFGADALAYACLIFLVLGVKLNRKQWIGVWITTIGIVATYIISSFAVGPVAALPGLLEGLGSSLALATIILVNSVLIQHDPPLRVAFYQCVIGAIIFAFISLIFSPNDFSILKQLFFDESGLRIVSYLAMSGICYAIALLFFFRAFLFTEPLVIASLSYSLAVFLFASDFLINKQYPKMIDVLLSAIVSCGCYILIKCEYSHDKIRTKISSYGAQYIPNLLEKMFTVSELFKSKSIEWTEYMSRMHEYNKLLFGFSKRIEKTEINNIAISSDAVIFAFQNPPLKMITDGACRSAPFEILNFGKYEIEEALIFDIIADGDCIFDIGSHIGWFSLNFAYKFPNSTVYAFEPISETFEILEKNIKINDLKNIKYFNFGFSSSERESEFFYFKGGSVLSSEKNLIDHKKTETKKVLLKTIDKFTEDHKIQRLDFIKCDVEGNEFSVLKGAQAAIALFLPIIYIEIYEPWCKKFDYSGNDIIRYLGEYGYECFFVENARLVKTNIVLENSDNYNYFFLHRLKHANIVLKFAATEGQ
ncbi:MAG: FkbM family methyltransferase [Chlamydiales bacterium]|nr:FkbM family methyltransferase [Chlamydiales bacterium]